VNYDNSSKDLRARRRDDVMDVEDDGSS